MAVCYFQNEVEEMLGSARTVSIIFAIVVASAGFLLVLNRVWSTEERRQHNDIVGWQISVIGTTYAVIIGFMLYAVWGNFQVAESNTDAEANSLVNLSRLAEGLPQEQRQPLQSLAKEYANSMVNNEWPAMNRNSLAPDGMIIMRQLWKAVSRPEDLNVSQQEILDHTISTLSELTEHRRLRQLESRMGLPHILWAVLVAGAILTIASACLFGTKSFRLHLLQVFGLSLLVAMSLMAIAEIDRPFQGSVSVSPDAFIRAEQSMQAY